MKNKHNSIIFTLNVNRNNSYDISNLSQYEHVPGYIVRYSHIYKKFSKRLYCIFYYFHVLGTYINLCIISTYS